MMEAKIEKKSFGIAEFAEEEKWLEEQHRNGWRLIKTNGTKYQFERCDGDEWVYQIDFKEKGTAEEEYIQMFKDCGWEYILQYDKWCYFRRKKENGADLSIFSDRFSKIDMYTKILQSRRLIVTVALFSIACVIEWLSFFTPIFKGEGGGYWVDFWKAAAPWIGCGFFVATSFSVNQYIKLRRMLNELKTTDK
ncbi:MAG: DUF2812 domain-containing protein [Bacillota bacterium]|nr:DUF2812 domain-containing protein [Bacillota bacterium]